MELEYLDLMPLLNRAPTAAPSLVGASSAVVAFDSSSVIAFRGLLHCPGRGKPSGSGCVLEVVRTKGAGVGVLACDTCRSSSDGSIGASSAVVAFASLSPPTGPLVVLCRLIRCWCSIDFLQNTWNQHRHRTFLQSVQNTLCVARCVLASFAVFVVCVLVGSWSSPGAEVEKFQTKFKSTPAKFQACLIKSI